MAFRVGYNLDSFVDFQGVSIDTNNLLSTARHLWEKSTLTGRHVRDRLSDPQASGLPLTLPPNTYAETVFACVEPGDYEVAWDGGAAVQVQLLGGTDSGGQFQGTSEHLVRIVAEWPQDDPAPAPAVSGSFRFTHPGQGITQAALRISTPSGTDPLRNLRVVPVAQAASWQEFSPRFYQRAAEMRSPWVRLLDMMQPAEPTYRAVATAPGEFRPDGYFTQSNTWLDVWSVPAGAWTGTVPTNGSLLAIERWNGSAWSQIGQGDVTRIGSPTGRWGHLKLSGSHGLSGDRLRDVDTGATATLTADMGLWEDIVQGLSMKMVRDLLAALRPFGLVGAVIPFFVEMTQAGHEAWATSMRDDARLDGLLVGPEHGNETWNSQLGGYARTYNYCNTQGVALGMPQYPSSPWYAGAQWYALRQSEIHAWWRAVYGARAAEVKRYFFGQLRAGTHWADWRTIINADNLAGFPAWPRQVLPIDGYFVNCYAAHTDEAPYNTTAWQRSATEQDWFAYVDSQITADFKAPGSSLVQLRTWATARGCELNCYEGQFHILAAGGGDQQSHDSIVRFLRSHWAGLAFEKLLNACQAQDMTVWCAYNSVRRWGRFSGYWGLVESYVDPAATNRLWRVAMRFNAEAVLDYDDSTVRVRADQAGLQLVSSPPVTFDFPAIGAGSLRLAGTALLEQEAPEIQILVPSPSLTRSITPAATLEVVEAQHLIFASPALQRSYAGQPDLMLIPPALEIVDLLAQPATSSTSASAVEITVAGIFDLEAGAALSRSNCTAVQLESVAVDDPFLGGTRWVSGPTQHWPKARGYTMRRMALLGQPAPGADLVPLRGGMAFFGVAAEFAGPVRDRVLVSRSGQVLIDLEDAGATPVGRFRVVAVDDERFFSEAYASGRHRIYSIVGMGTGFADGRVLLDYRGLLTPS